MDELKGKSFLKYKLALKRNRVLTRYEYYDCKEQKIIPGPIIPVELKNTFKSTLGWCAKAVNALADRLIFDQFENDLFDINEIYSMNNPDIIFDNAILSALISSCCFIYISPDNNGYPRLQVIDGGNATGIIDPITGLLKEGYAVLSRDEYDNATSEAYFRPGMIIYTDLIKKTQKVFKTVVKYPLLVPIINRPDASRPFGHSRISRACMSLQNKAKNVLTRADVSAEFYSFPQKYIVGMSQDAEHLDKWKATISSMLQFSKDEDGDSPNLGQFQQQSMAPHLEHFKLYASAFAGETGLTLDDLGFPTNNPSSAEAIKAAHETLRCEAKRAQRTFGAGFLNAGFLAACLRDETNYERKAFYQTKPTWYPVFEADAGMLSSIGDGVIKINQVMPGYINDNNLRQLTGIKRSESNSDPTDIANDDWLEE